MKLFHVRLCHAGRSDDISTPLIVGKETVIGDLTEMPIRVRVDEIDEEIRVGYGPGVKEARQKTVMCRREFCKTGNCHDRHVEITLDV